MSFENGRGNNGNNSNKAYEKTYYSRLGFKDYTHDSKYKLGFSYRSGMLIVDISGEKSGGFEFESLANIFITATKANILLEMMKRYEEDIANGTFDPANGYGINTGMGATQTVLILGLTDNGERCITISKVSETGNIEKTCTYIFNTNFHYGLSWSNVKGMNFEKVYVENVEYEMFKQTIISFANNINGAIGYVVADIARYDHTSIMNKMNPIYDKLGIERQNSNGRSSGSSNGGYFNNDNGNRTSEHKSYDEMEEDLPY